MGLQGFCVKKGGRDCRSRSPGVCSSDDVFRLEFFEYFLAVHLDPDAVSRQGVDADEPDRLREEADFRISLPTAEELDAGEDLFPGLLSVDLEVEYPVAEQDVVRSRAFGEGGGEHVCHPVVLGFAEGDGSVFLLSNG